MCRVDRQGLSSQVGELLKARDLPSRLTGVPAGSPEQEAQLFQACTFIDVRRAPRVRDRQFL